MATLGINGIKPRLLVIALLAACLSFHIPHSTQWGQAPITLSSHETTSLTANGNTAGRSTFYITGNVTVAPGQNYTVSNENLVLESLSSSTLTFTVFGNLSIMNSNVSIENASYSTLNNFSIVMQPGSHLLMDRSNLSFPGHITFDHSDARIENSTLSSTVTKTGNPYDESLGISLLHSNLSISNSTVSGLYRQNGSHEYSDGFKYLYLTPYSASNTTVPMKEGNNLDNRSLINSVKIDVTYTSTFNESVNYLETYIDGAVSGKYVLPYNLSGKNTTRNILLNFSGKDNNLQWMENTSNFHLVTVVNSQKPITILNVSEYFLSNDTVSLYGKGIYSYNITDSNAVIYNSSIGLNQESVYLKSGQQNPGRLYMSLINSTFVMADSSLIVPGPYVSPFFTNENSSIFFASALSITALSHNITIQNLNDNISAYGSPNLSGNGFLNVLNATEDRWISHIGGGTVVYETDNSSDVFNYTNTFSISTDGDVTQFSLSPFPVLNRGPFPLILTADSVPYAFFSIHGTSLSTNGSGSFYLNWSGNLSGLVNLSANWDLKNSASVVGNGSDLINSTVNQGQSLIKINTGTQIASGTYTLNVYVKSPQERAFYQNGKISQNYFVSKAPLTSREVRITATNLVTGTVWGVNYNNLAIYTNSTSLSLNVTQNSTARIMDPSGFESSPADLNFTFTQSQYNVTFSRVEYSVTFENHNLTSGRSWEVLIGGKKFQSTNFNIMLALPAGSYNYEVIDPSGFHTSKPSGIIHVINSSEVVGIQSVKIITWSAYLVNIFQAPQFYLPLTILIISVISLAGWNASHKWYICTSCGSTRKKKREQCPYCGKD